MFTDILKFDWNFFAKKKSFPILLLSFLAFGMFTAMAANFPFPETYKNAPYIITYIIGIMSLVCIFIVTLLTAQGLLREKDAQFDLILYATPIRKRDYLSSRFIVIFGITTITFAMYCIGFYIGHQIFREHPEEFANTGIFAYIQPFLLMAIPNILFCTGIICSIGVLTKNKIVIYISGLFIYFLYWGIAMFTNSPLMANASPLSPESMQLMAKMDPFGISAFFEQTKYWSAIQRNTSLLELKGNFLFNRLLYLFIALALTFLAYKRFAFTIGKQKIAKIKNEKTQFATKPYQPVAVSINGIGYRLNAWCSFVKIDLQAVFKSIPIWIMLFGWTFFLGMEIIGNIDAGVRLPQRFATTTLMVSDILKLFPVIGLLIVLFYGSEIFWRSHSARFEALEKSTPVPTSVVLLSKWSVLSLVPIILILCSILTGILFQLTFQNAPIDWSLYASLFYLIGLPLSLSAAFVVCIQALSPNKYIGLVISSVLLLLTNTSLGGMLGMKHPLWRFANAYQGNYSEMNGFDLFLEAFHIKMLFWAAIVILLIFWTANRTKKYKVGHYLLLTGCLTVGIWSGTVIIKETFIPKRDEQNNWKQAYEEKYKRYENLSQPIITDVKANIDLFPETNTYTVTATYTLVNKGTEAIDSILVYADKELKWDNMTITNARLLSEDATYGHFWYKLNTALPPGNTAKMNFQFRYKPSVFNDFMQFNNILKNGTFIRISNFFPGFGYQPDNEIDDPKERVKRKMPKSALIKPLEEKAVSAPYYINLETTISTTSDQIAIGIGELKKSWQHNNRQYYHYKTEAPIPFRFAVASARFATQKIKHRNISIEVYYHPDHSKNIGHLVRNAKLSLDYCEQNFSPYPYKTIRFVEISSFTKGFAATAYPTDFFINESFGFQNKIEESPEKDILNELVSHELSHNWWGNATINPENQEGSKLLTETLAMYTELMVYKKAYGLKNIPSRVQVHKDIYLSGRSFATEEPLYKSNPDKSYLCYDKGMVVMYQLEQLIGEQKINQALRNLLKKYSYPHLPPTSLDLLQEFYAVSDVSFHPKIDELFKQIITYDLQLKQASYTKKENDEYVLSILIITNKYKEDGKGKQELIPFDEPVELIITDEDGKTETVLLNKAQHYQLKRVFKRKPVTVVVDPNLRFMDVNTENNQKELR